MEPSQPYSKDTAEQTIQEAPAETTLSKPWHAPLTRVTTFSKYFALALFIILPFAGFWLGVEYGFEKMESSNSNHLLQFDWEFFEKQCENSGGIFVPPPGSINALGRPDQEWCVCQADRELDVDSYACVEKSEGSHQEVVKTKEEDWVNSVQFGNEQKISDLSIVSQTGDVVEVIVRGKVTPGGQDDCVRDGICSFVVGEQITVIWSEGEVDKFCGTNLNVIEIGDEVEVYGRLYDNGRITICGSREYYIDSVFNDRLTIQQCKARGGVVYTRYDWFQSPGAYEEFGVNYLAQIADMPLPAWCVEPCANDDQCCQESLKMGTESENYILMNGGADECIEGYEKKQLKCSTSLDWCQRGIARSLLQQCPASHIVNKMPCAYESSPSECNDPPREYYILDGSRREIEEFDSEWVKNNCSVTPEEVY